MTLLLSARGLVKAYGPRPLFTDLTVEIRAGERIGLIGPNGSGKSTLLRLLAEREEADGGERSVRRGARIAYLAQDDRFASGRTAREILLDALEGEPLEEYERETQAVIVLTQVGFADPDVQADTLSGGWRKRLALARELVRSPDLLLLDEPTNHLDLPGVVWLERFLRSAPFAFLVASHDRAFLRNVAQEILEINRVFPTGAFRVAGEYQFFLDKRDEFLAGQARREEAVANQVRRETEWLGRKESAQRRKSASRIEDAARRREELAELKFRNNSGGSAAIDFAGTGRQTRKLLVAQGISRAIAGRSLFAGLDLTLSPGMRLGLLGTNGSGKSTLLRTLAGLAEPNTGSIVRAEGARCILFEQGRTALNPQVTLRRALCPNGDTVVHLGRSLHVVAWAKQFLFREEQLEVPIGSLSGGEQARVRIAQLMLQPADLLFLDEPTNDLDIPALEVLEESLLEFPGAIVLVSHDRELMDRVCTEVVGLDGRGGSSVFATVDQWLAAYDTRERATEVQGQAQPVSTAGHSERQAKSTPGTIKSSAPSTPKPKKLSYKELQEYEGIEAAIQAAELLVGQRESEVGQSAGAGHVVLAEACRALEEAQREVERLYARWQELEERRTL